MSFFSSFKKWQPYSISLVRIGLAIVFLWFGINQLLFPSTFMGYVPSWAIQGGGGMMGNMIHNMIMVIPHPATSLLYFNGIIEIMFGIMMLFGIYTRLSAVVLAIHLVIITISLGYNDVAVRDFGLALATASIFLHGPDRLCLDKDKKD